MNSKSLAWNIRKHSIEMTNRSNGSHIACVLSVADIIAVLYAKVMKYDVSNPKNEERDRIILSKGHAGAAIYSALAEVGFIDKDELKTHYSNGSRLSGHVSHKGIPGVEFSTGSLGHGLAVGTGFAMAAKVDGKSHRVFVVLGDGECNEGAVWESVLFSNHFRLNNLIAIIDYNKMQALDYCDKTIQLSPFADKWKAFGWQVIEVDGHNHDELENAINEAGRVGKPTVIIAHTIKGKGISFMENNIVWHYRPPMGDDYNAALKELEVSRP